MNYLLIDPIDLSKKSLIPFRQILDEIAEKKSLKIPVQLDLTVDCVLMAYFLTYASNIFNDGYYDENFEKEIVNHIYNKNIGKLMSTNMNGSDYSFEISKHIPNYKVDYFKLDMDNDLAKRLILLTLKTSQNEIFKFLKSYENGDIIIPKIQFINCFIHPTGMIHSKFYSYFEQNINDYSLGVFEYLLVETRLYMQDVKNRLDKMQKDLNL